VTPGGECAEQREANAAGAAHGQHATAQVAVELGHGRYLGAQIQLAQTRRPERGQVVQ
jgi:hypothetical protein